jgi:hypothetical protein
MTKLFWAIGPALTLAACGSQPANEANAASPVSNAAEAAVNAAAPALNAANTVAPVDTAAADEAAVRDAVAKVYASYSNPKAPGPVLSKPFKAAWDHALSKDGVMDADPFCGCQDYDKFHATVKSVKVDGDHARASHHQQFRREEDRRTRLFA